ncbi:MAG: aspartate kinase [Candidatus Altiarchaeota archaeon]
MVVVMKFGGTSVADGERIRNVVKLVKAENRKKIVVVSAMSGVTDRLISMARSVVNLPNNNVEHGVDAFCRDLAIQQRNAIVVAVGKKSVRSEVLGKSMELIEKLRVALLGVGYLEDLSPRSLDYVMSFGERLNILVMSGALVSAGVRSVALSGGEAGIVTDSVFGRANPLHVKSKKKVGEILKKLVNRATPVVAGFIAADEKGRITTLGRGGSDYTASLLGKYLDAEEVQIWTDVDGILTTDPKVVPHAKLIPTLSYSEALDLAYYGARVIHSKMIEPAMTAKIPVWVKNTFNPSCEGTLIVKEQKMAEQVIKAVASAKDVVIINMEGSSLVDSPNVAGRFFSALGEGNIDILMVSGSWSNLSFVIRETDLENAMHFLSQKFSKSFMDRMEVLREVSIVTVVGAGMRTAKGIAAGVFGAVNEAGVSIIMIAQGSSKLNIAFVVKSKDANRVVAAIHDRFIG